MRALIDMDLVVFRCAASAENDDLNIAIYRVEELMDNILTKTNSDEYKAYLSSATNFRKTIYPEYKANRKGEKPRHLADLKDYAISKLNAEISPEGLEADDMLGIEQDKQTKATTICTLDKDLLQIPGLHFSWEISGPNWNRPDTWIEQTELEGMRFLYEQAIKGDTTDNIKGIPGKGKVFAKKVLEKAESEKEMFDIVRNLYSNDEEFKMNTGCVWILKNHNETFAERFNYLASI